MTRQAVRRIVIAGGGAAGWMSAAVLAKVLKPQNCTIQLVESDDIGIIGVGEATIAGIHWLNNILGIEEDDFVRASQATFKLGIDFRDWTGAGRRYYHPFGRYGVPLGGVGFHHLWVKAQRLGLAASFEDYCMTSMAARLGRFDRPDRAPPGSPLKTLSYAYHLDAGRYARYLRTLAVGMGVERIEGTIERVDQNPETGYITRLHTRRGDVVEGDLFLDCTGFHALLIQGVLQTGTIDLSNFLPCDRAWAVPCERTGDTIEPSTRCTARAAGWQWRIPLQHRTGNGHVFCNEFMSEDEAHDVLMRNLDGRPLGEAKLIKFKTGRTRQVWNKNVIAVGLSAGFLEPLEATTIHIILNSLNKIIGHFPRRTPDPLTVAEFNRQLDLQFDTIKDFLVLHYRLSEGRDEPLWRYFRQLTLPERLERMIESFRMTARIAPSEFDQFKEASWFSVMLGQGVVPEDHDPLADNIDDAALASHLARVRDNIRQIAERMPAHDAYIRANCATPVPA